MNSAALARTEPSAEAQRTIARPATLAGVGLLSGKAVRVTLRPAPADSGVVFQRVDLPGRPAARALLDNVLEAERHTALRAGSAEVHLVEHLLAAAAAAGADNLMVELDAEELPALDGSAAPYLDALTKAGLVAQNSRRSVLRLPRAIEVRRGQARLAALPAREGLRVHFTLDYGDKFLRRQEIETEIAERTLARDLAPARTFVLRSEVEEFLRRGLGGGATAENLIVVEEDGTTAASLRFPDECVRHKVLDLVGDLQLLGARLVAAIVGFKSGHRMNLELAREIRRAACRL